MMITFYISPKTIIITIFGHPQINYIQIGTCFGHVKVDHTVNTFESFKNIGIKINEEVAILITMDILRGDMNHFFKNTYLYLLNMLKKQSKVSNKVIIGRTAGEDHDNGENLCGYLLTKEELQNIKNITNLAHRIQKNLPPAIQIIGNKGFSLVVDKKAKLTDFVAHLSVIKWLKLFEESL